MCRSASNIFPEALCDFSYLILTIEIPLLFSTSNAAELRPIFGMLRQIPTIIQDKAARMLYVLEIDRIFLVIILKSPRY